MGNNIKYFDKKANGWGNITWNDAITYMHIHFTFSDFSLKAWRISKGLPSTGALSIHMAAQLMDDLGLTDFLLESSCSGSSPPYFPSSQGFNEGLIVFILNQEIFEFMKIQENSANLQIKFISGIKFLQ